MNRLSLPAHRLIAVSALAFAILALSGHPALARPHYAWQSSYRAVVDQTAAVVQGTVTEIAESYSEEEGPRALVTLSRVNVLWGDLKDEKVTLKLFGGSVPGPLRSAPAAPRGASRSCTSSAMAWGSPSSPRARASTLT